jgi:hypothetical protein
MATPTGYIDSKPVFGPPCSMITMSPLPLTMLPAPIFGPPQDILAEVMVSIDTGINAATVAFE